ncbi:NrtR DNA-binding winged helix domain-containing protein [Flagellimonas marina]|uniref:NrtR DNA-binding winged helix domain-containing protein n=1 Tax=Flagellimonas marina TaxID=1775168 RepID=A0ABV8PNW8_9FLAO
MEAHKTIQESAHNLPLCTYWVKGQPKALLVIEELLPKQFTLSELQQLYEDVLNL